MGQFSGGDQFEPVGSTRGCGASVVSMDLDSSGKVAVDFKQFHQFGVKNLVQSYHTSIFLKAISTMEKNWNFFGRQNSKQIPFLWANS